MSLLSKLNIRSILAGYLLMFKIIILLTILDTKIKLYRINTIKEPLLMKKIRNSYEPCCSLNISGDEQERMIKISKALGNPIRFNIMKFLLTHPGCITGDIVQNLPIAQATTSQHLKVLKSCGLIEGEIEGTKSCYWLNNKTLIWYKGKIRDIF